MVRGSQRLVSVPLTVIITYDQGFPTTGQGTIYSYHSQMVRGSQRLVSVPFTVISVSFIDTYICSIYNMCVFEVITFATDFWS